VFRDFIALERQVQESEEARDFWTGQLQDMERTRLLAWHPEEEDKDRTPVNMPLPDAVVVGLRELAGTAGVPQKSVFLAAHVWIVGRIRGTRDVVTGLVTNGRPEALDADRVLGMFLNTVPLRTSLAGGSWVDLARNVFETERAILPFRRYPLPDIQREANSTEFFNTSFNYTNFYVLAEAQQATGMKLESAWFSDETSIPLAVDIDQGSLRDTIRLRVQRDPAVLNKPQLRAIVDLYLRVLSAMANAPAGRYDTADLLSPGERQQILHEWNDTTLVAHLEAELVHEVFEQWAALTPDAPALLCSRGVMSYRELSRRANRIARLLRASGAGPEVAVGLYMERSAEMIAGLLGILKAGAAYVPLDPAHPRERLLLLIEDVHIPLVVTQERLVASIAGLVAEVIAVDRLDGTGAEGGAVPPSGVRGDNIAYIVFTSGSTGRPKPVGVSHRALTRHMAGTRQVLRMREHRGDRVLQFSTLNFDGSVDQIFIALVNGGCLALREEEMWSAEELEERIVQMGLTIIDLPTGYWSEWVRARSLAPEREDGLRVVYVGGEAMMSEELAVWWRSPRNRNVRLLNAYGPTETVVAASFLEATSRESAGSLFERVAIGHPLGGRALHVVDPDGRLAPIGVAGELLIAGEPILARGYLGRPDLTAERFLPDPFSPIPGARLYRTGDLGRYLPDGRREFLGRVDDQVKVRGFRIELGEIEAVLAEHSAVHRAAAVVHGHGRLVAYVTPLGEPPTAEDLLAYLRAKLPEPMVPSDIVLLDRLPLTPNGKVDRRALPAPKLSIRRSAGPLQGPRNDMERQLVAIWEELLGVSPIGLEDDFLELGGHSLLAVRLMARIEHAFGVKLPIAALFETPTVAGLALGLEEALQSGADRTPPLVPVPREGPLPLSFAQQRLWFIDQLGPGRAVYSIPIVLRVAGPLNSAVLALCLGEVVRRHEALRTVFAMLEGSPIQVIQPAVPFVLSAVDLSGLAPRAREALAITLASEEAGRGFDLARGPLFRGMLWRLSEGDNVVALTMHHIVSDAWSIGILIREVRVLYEALVKNRPSPLPELPVQYADFTAWQYSWLHGEALEKELAFWRQQLAGLPQRLELPTDRPRPAVQSSRGELRPVWLTAELTRQMYSLSRREGATLFMVLLAGFQALLARHSGQQDLAVGTPTAGRSRIEVEGLIGFFVNTLVLRGDLTSNARVGPSFRELLSRVRETALAAHAHQDVPFEKLVQELAPERNLAHSPLFQVMFVLQNAPVESLEIENLRLRPVVGAGKTAKFDLTLSLAEQSDGLAGAVELATDLFDTATIDRWIAHFGRLLAEAVATPDRSALALPLLDEAERGQVLREWNDTRADGLAKGCLHHDVAAQAARTPSAVAIELGSERWTYRRLVSSARRLARHLRMLSVGPDEIVGLCTERSPAMIVGMLAVLEAGGAFLPLDPTYPAERLEFMLNDSGARVLLVQERLLDWVPATDCPVVPLGAHWDCDEETGEPLGVEVTADHLAYVIYTSGSTGRPKGVMVPHRGVCNWLHWSKQVYRLDARDAVLQRTSFGFDAAVWECFAPLSVGARLVLAEPGRQGDSLYLVRVLQEHRVTFAGFVPSSLAAFLDEEDVKKCVSLRQIVVGGELLTPELRDRALARLSVPLDNHYGPTEASINTARWACAPGQGTSWVPIGRPIGNSQLYAVDRELQPMPIGGAGELLVGGAGVTRGYLRRPDLTAERFIPDPFGGAPGARLYRTGDLVRWLPDATLNFLGRLDHQVKVRGFRIELGEIERILQEHPDVHRAVVVARSDGPVGQKQLVAYFVAAATPPPAAASLRSFLAERLPAYMVPAVFMMLESLPLSPNGKVDRMALPPPEATRSGAAREYVAPRTPEEERLATVWAQVLRLPQVGVNDNFFELGGDSILSIQIVARARQAGLLFTVRQIFEHQTVAELARYAEITGAALSAPEAVAGSVPLTPIQRWFFEQDFKDLHHFNQALLLAPAGPLVPAALESAMAAVVEHHDALRLRFGRQGETDIWWQENAAAEPITPFHCIDLSNLPAPRRQEALEGAAATLQTGFDLSAGPLTRLALFEAGAGEPGLLLWVAHHLVVDGVSWRVLLEDLEAAYRQTARGLRPTLPPKTTSFRDWALRLVEHAGAEVLAGELDHWLEVAQVTVPRLPVDFPAVGENTAGTEAAVSCELTAAETADLLQVVPSIYHNRIDEALLSALARALAGWTGCPRLRVDLEGHGREPLFEDLDTSRTVGWFTTCYPVILEAGDADSGKALMNAKERLRAVPERGIGYGLLRYLAARDGGPARLLAAVPAAEIIFNYLGQLESASGDPALFRLSTASAGSPRSPRGHRTHLLGISGMVAGGRLRITLTYSSRVHRQETAERLAAAYSRALRQLIQHCNGSESEVFTPSDFPKAKLNDRSFNKLSALLDEPD
jgi:amino acid adenylation domain-containing protein/non-ribosomal peptide synthase protein (TIGR01720 family)